MNLEEIIKQNILNLFQDNVVGAISARDIRAFVDTIFDTKENSIQIFERLQEIDTYNPSPELSIKKFDLIVITDHNNTNTIKETGVYISLKDKPTSNDVLKVSSLNYDEFLKQGKDNQLITLVNGELTWIDPLPGYFIQGRKNIDDILSLRPTQRGIIFIANDTNLTAPVPGNEGDGYSWIGDSWVNIGPLQGPQGEPGSVVFADQYEVNDGTIKDKAISPYTFNNSSQLQQKEDYLGTPGSDGQILASDVDGTRYWVANRGYNGEVEIGDKILKIENGLITQIRNKG